MIKKHDALFSDIRSILQQARQKAYAAVNFAMVEAYWLAGKRIVEEEQQGKFRAEYGAKLLIELSHRLTAEFGPGFSPQSLRNMRQFYLLFIKCSALRRELSRVGRTEHRVSGKPTDGISFFESIA